MNVVTQLKFISSVSCGTAAFCGFNLVQHFEEAGFHFGEFFHNVGASQVLDGLGFLVSTTTCAVTLNLLSWQPSPSHSWKSLLTMWSYRRAQRKNAVKFIGKLQQAKQENIRELQTKYLLGLLQRMSGTKYGIDHNFSEIKSIAEFQEKIPVNKYENVEHYFKRVMAGEGDVVTPGPAEFLCKTTGSTGKNKVYPMTTSGVSRYFEVLGAAYWAPFFYHMGRDICPTLHRVLTLQVYPPMRYNEIGLKIGPATSMLSPTPGFMTVPIESLLAVHDEKTALYIIAVFSIREDEVDMIHVYFPALTLSFIRTIERHWPQMCDDVEHGRLADFLPLENSLRKCIEAQMAPRRRRARQLRKIFKEGFRHIFTRLWPSVNFIQMFNSGSFRPTFNYLKQKYFGPTLNCWSMMIAATEGMYALNLHDMNMDEPIYHPLVCNYLFEFIHEDNIDDENPRVLLLDELVIGQRYEILFSGDSGFYRIRPGDVIQVVGYDGSVPLIKLSHRVAWCLNVYNEKISESCMQLAISQVFDALRPEKDIIDYTVVESPVYEMATEKRHGERYYVLFLETTVSLSEVETNMFDGKLQSIVENYSLHRRDGRIDPIHVIQLARDSFTEFKFFLLSRNLDASTSQFKMPRVVRDTELVKFLISKEL